MKSPEAYIWQKLQAICIHTKPATILRQLNWNSDCDENGRGFWENSWIFIGRFWAFSPAVWKIRRQLMRRCVRSGAWSLIKRRSSSCERKLEDSPKEPRGRGKTLNHTGRVSPQYLTSAFRVELPGRFATTVVDLGRHTYPRTYIRI